MADSISDEAIAQFTTVTGAPSRQAQQYLAAHGGDVEAAVQVTTWLKKTTWKTTRMIQTTVMTMNLRRLHHPHPDPLVVADDSARDLQIQTLQQQPRAHRS